MEAILGQNTYYFTRLIEIQSIGCPKPKRVKK